jgi:hypothetical protein
MSNCYIWLSVLTDLYESRISSSLIDKGYTIGPADGKSVLNGNCLAYYVQHADKTVAQVEEDVVDIIVKNQLYYHFLLVSERTDYVVWRSSNIVFKTISKEEQEIEDAMNKINHLLHSYQVSPLTEEEKKRLIEKRKNS